MMVTPEGSNYLLTEFITVFLIVFDLCKKSQKNQKWNSQKSKIKQIIEHATAASNSPSTFIYYDDINLIYWSAFVCIMFHHP